MTETLQPTTPDTRQTPDAREAGEENPPGRRRRRRWPWRLALVVLALLVLAIVATQIVLWTDVPRGIVLQQVQRALGLRMTAASVSTGWFGRTTLRDVTLALPLSHPDADESLLRIPELRVRHTWLPMLLATRRIDIDALELAAPKLLVQQDDAGRWNVLEVVELLARTAGKKTATAAPEGRKAARLPEIVIRDATVTITDRAGRTATVDDVDFAGKPDGPLVWRYDLAAPELAAVGQLAPGSPWPHDVRFDTQDLAPLLSPWIGQSTAPIAIAANWKGELEGGRLSGRLDLRDATALGYGATGTVDAIGGDGSVTLHPRNLVLSTPVGVVGEARVASGTVVASGSEVTLERVELGVFGGLARVDARWMPATSAGELRAQWQNLSLPGDVRASGRLHGTLATPFPGQPQVAVTLDSRGAAHGVEWDGTARLDGSGRGWDDVDWTVTIPRLVLRDPREMIVTDLVARLTTRGQVVTLDEVRLASADRIAGRGQVNFADQTWSLWLAGQGWDIPRVPDAQTAFNLDIWGDFKRLNLKQVYVRTGDLEIMADGLYDSTVPQPVDVNVYAWHLPELRAALGPTGSASVAPPTAGPTGRASPAPIDGPPSPDGSTDARVAGAEPGIELRGRLRAEAHVTGTLFDRDLGIAGRLFANDLYFRDRPLGDAMVQLTGTATAEQATLGSTEMELLGGHWALYGTWSGSTPARESNLRVRIAVRDLPLGELGAALGEPSIEGVLDGGWTFDLPDFDRDRLTAFGSFDARDLRVQQVRVDLAEGRVTYGDGQLVLDPLRLKRQDGTADVTASVALAQPERPKVTVATRDWPVDVPRTGIHAGVTGTAELTLDLTQDQPRVAGPIAGRANVYLNNEWVAEARVEAGLSGRVLTVRQLEADVLGGQVEGSARVNADDLLDSTAVLTWHDLDASLLSAQNPGLAGLLGRFGGTARLGPANDPRALEPLRLDIVLDAHDANFRGTPIGDARLTAFFNRDRVVLGDSATDPSTIRLADGIVRVWGRVSRHAPARPGARADYASVLHVELDRLDLDELVRAASPAAPRMPGRLSGDVRIVGDPTQPARMSGQGTLNLAESDLVNLDVFADLYQRMNVFGAPEDPRGRGTAHLLLENSTLTISEFRYFNRGTEVRARAAIGDVWQIPDSPIDGTAVGSTRPFASLKIPFMADVDDILSVVQTNVVSVRISGTVRDRIVQVIPFSEVGNTMRRILVGDVRSETRGGAGR